MAENPMLSADYVEWMYAPESRIIGVYGLVFDAGIMTHFKAVLEIGDAFVILTNSQRSWPFISYLLSDWAQWRSFPSVGMGRIIWGQYGLSAIIGMLLSASLMIIVRLIPAFYWQKRTRTGLGQRLLRIGLVLSVWPRGAMLFLSAALLLSSLLPIFLTNSD